MAPNLVPKITEKMFYALLITVLVIIAILLPIIVIQTDSSSSEFIYLSTDEDDISNGSTAQTVRVYPDQYFTPTELAKFLDTYASQRSILFSTKQIGKTSPLDNPIKEVVLMKKRQFRPKVVIVSGILANDWCSVLVSVAIMNKFFSDVKRTELLLNDFNFHFIPLLNPDGYNYSRTRPINSHWIYNYKGMKDGKPTGLNVLYGFSDQGETPQEASLFKSYFEKNKKNIEAVFVLFTFANLIYSSRHFTIPDGYMNPKAKRRFIEKVAYAVEREQEGKFRYTQTLHGDNYSGRIDDWIIRETKPDPILVVNFNADFRVSAPELLPIKMKTLGDEIHFIATRLLALLKATKNFVPSGAD